MPVAARNSACGCLLAGPSFDFVCRQRSTTNLAQHSGLQDANRASDISRERLCYNTSMHWIEKTGILQTKQQDSWLGLWLLIFEFVCGCVCVCGRGRKGTVEAFAYTATHTATPTHNWSERSAACTHRERRKCDSNRMAQNRSHLEGNSQGLI